MRCDQRGEASDLIPTQQSASIEVIERGSNHHRLPTLRPQTRHVSFLPVEVFGGQSLRQAKFVRACRLCLS